MTNNANHKLAAISNELNVLLRSDEALLKYDALSDALYWTDEIPANASDGPEKYWCMQQVLRYRTSLITGQPDIDLVFTWDEATRLFPNWPGFSPDRCKTNHGLTAKYESFRQRAIDAFNAIPD